MSGAAGRARDVISSLLGESVRVRSMPANWAEPEPAESGSPSRRSRAHVRDNPGSAVQPSRVEASEVQRSLRLLERSVRRDVAQQLRTALQGEDPQLVDRVVTTVLGDADAWQMETSPDYLP